VRYSSNDRYSRVSIANHGMKRDVAIPADRLLPHVPARLSCDPPMFAEAGIGRDKTVTVAGPDCIFQLKRSTRILDLMSKYELMHNFSTVHTVTRNEACFSQREVHSAAGPVQSSKTSELDPQSKLTNISSTSYPLF
jgi:hypothetical protein